MVFWCILVVYVLPNLQKNTHTFSDFLGWSVDPVLTKCGSRCYNPSSEAPGSLSQFCSCLCWRNEFQAHNTTSKFIWKNCADLLISTLCLCTRTTGRYLEIYCRYWMLLKHFKIWGWDGMGKICPVSIKIAVICCNAGIYSYWDLLSHSPIPKYPDMISNTVINWIIRPWPFPQSSGGYRSF